ncbi:indolepyruvate ferredoxin oxidoreductase subunit alpha [Desulfovibrio inopinatus]|uniref:indolepyruvate ferredoxin oxidoreductase subunit alpha n=1 Tax=Desulfovibrio inopinatus TaxID=102109 RepID=UPI00041ADCA1|nr:indolepyruvate ferredoxin oxidoreductase subunit alpha [Desulfovibrio inopinatus]
MPNPLLADAPGQVHFLLGNEAIVRGALEAGVQFISCYPGTPSSEVPDTFFRLASDASFTFEYSINEKVAMEVAGGAALAGVPTLVTMKHVGVNVAADPLMTLSYISTPGGLVILSADDPGCHSSQNEQDNRYYARLAKIPCFEPSTAQECKDYMIEAMRFSIEHAQPVMLRTTTRVNHIRGAVTFGALPVSTHNAPFEREPVQFVPVPAFSRIQHQRLLSRLTTFSEKSEFSPLNTITGQGKVGVITSGICRAYLHDALLDEDATELVKCFELGMTHPLPEKRILDFVSGLDTLIILEELEPILETAIRALLQKHHVSLEVVGKGEDAPLNDEYSTVLVRRILRRALGRPVEQNKICQPQATLPKRPPNLCAGCPHRASYHAVREVFGEDVYFSSDIGCYTLGFLPPFRAVDFILCMGSSISAGSGFSKASGKPVISFIGDSTFFHSGITGLINAVFNNHDILLVILDNRTTAMTGHQPHPGVSDTVLGPAESRVDIEGIVRACGVAHVAKVNPFNKQATVTALEQMRDTSGVRVLILEAPCPIHDKKIGKKGKPMVASVEGDPTQSEHCLESLACPAFHKRTGTFDIDPDHCAGCMYCLQVGSNIKAQKRGAK